MGFSEQIKKSVGGDEYYTLQNSVDMILPYVLERERERERIWCPFDKDESLFVQTFKKYGLDVVNGHIDNGQDFFNYKEPQGDIVISNPPFSQRQKIFEKLYEWDLPFALIINFNGLFDSQKRWELFKNNEPQLLIPKGRMKFYHKDKGALNSPNFQSIYICNKFLDKQIVFDDTKF